MDSRGQSWTKRGSVWTKWTYKDLDVDLDKDLKILTAWTYVDTFVHDMNNRSYRKLFSSIVTSSIWDEDSDTCKVWITLLAIADRYHEIQSTVKSISLLARVSVESCQAAMDKFLAPDISSSSQESEGRRIAVVGPNKWKLINGEKYADLMSEAERKEYKRQHEANRRRNAKCPPSVPECPKDVPPVSADDAPELLETGKAPSQTRQLTNAWCQEFEKVKGFPYKFQGAKDGKAAAALLKIGTPEAIMAIASAALRHRSWHCEKAVTLASLASKWNEIRSELNAPPPVQRTATLRQESLQPQSAYQEGLHDPSTL